MAAVCAIVVALVVVAQSARAGIAAGWFGVDATTIDTRIGASPPSWSHWFGTDTLGRDMLVRVLIGGRIALAIATITTVIALAIGVSWGAIAAYAGGRIDNLMMRTVDALYGFPTVVFIIVVMSVVDSRSLLTLFALIGAISWLTRWLGSFAVSSPVGVATATSSKRPARSASRRDGSCFATSCPTSWGR